MSAVKSQSRGGNYHPLSASQSFHQVNFAAQPNQAFSQPRFGSQGSHQPFAMMQQNLRRPCTLSQANHATFFQQPPNNSGGFPQQPGCNFAFLTSSSNQQDENNVNSAGITSETEKLESLKCLKVYFPKYSDAQLFSALGKAEWDSEKALTLLFEETYNQMNDAN